MEDNKKKTKAHRGFAMLDAERLREISRKGGLAVSQNKAYMAEISRRGHAAKQAKFAART